MHLAMDLIVIGFGTGGKLVAGAMGRHGARVAMIEQSDQMYGGTCINIGCVPTKSLVHLAETRNPDTDPDEWFRHAAYKTKNLTGLLRRKNFAALDAVETVTVITGRAAFLDPHTVTVATRHDTLTISAGVIVIDTGSEPVIPDIPGLSACCHAYTSTGLLDTTQRPRRLVVIGGGNVGLEFASVYAQFGSDVTVLEESGRLFAHEDDDVATAAISLLLDAGVNLRTGAHVTGIDDHAETAVVNYTHDGAEAAVEAEAILIAVGRVPATLGLGLHDAGVHTTDRGAVLVDDHLRSSRPHIYAVGDVNGGPQFTYISHDDSRIVLDQLTGPGTRSTADRVAVPSTVFLTPPLARVGMTERQAVEAGRSVDVAAKRIEDIAGMPRSEIMDDTRGLMKFVIDADTDEILGAALLCIDSQELINLVALAMRHHVTATELRDTIFTHPTSTEAIGEVLSARRPARAKPSLPAVTGVPS